MRKITRLALACTALMIGNAAFAQKQCNLGIQVTATPTTVNYKDTLFFNFTITNNGPASLETTDTIYFGAVGSNQVFNIIPSTTVATGGTIMLNKQIYRVHDIDTLSADLQTRFCFVLYAQSGITIDPDGNGPQPSRPATVTYTDAVATNDTSCTATVTFKKATSGLFEISGTAKEQLTVFPNPASDRIGFELNLDKATRVQVSVKDITGREVLREDRGMIKAGAGTALTVDISRLKAGMYFVEITGEEKRAVGRFTKQ